MRSLIQRGISILINNNAKSYNTSLNLHKLLASSHQLNYQPKPLFYSSEAVKAATKEEIDKLVKNKKVVVFMKGVPDEPRCGFSKAVVQILNMHGVSSYDSYDVLKDESIRQGIKEYSSWPTIPQVYINGEFVGGCDIMIEMHKNGELVEELKKAGIKSALIEDEKKS